MNQLLYEKLELSPAGDYWKRCEVYGSDLSLPSGKGTGVCIHQLLFVIHQGLLPGAVNSHSRLAHHLRGKAAGSRGQRKPLGKEEVGLLCPEE